MLKTADQGNKQVDHINFLYVKRFTAAQLREIRPAAPTAPTAPSRLPVQQ